MNYIHKLQGQVKARDAELKDVRGDIIELGVYLLSKKFRCGDSLDGYVNIQDVLSRLPE